MGRRRRDRRNRRGRGGPHGDGFGDQGDLLADNGVEEERVHDTHGDEIENGPVDGGPGGDASEEAKAGATPEPAEPAEAPAPADAVGADAHRPGAPDPEATGDPGAGDAGAPAVDPPADEGAPAVSLGQARALAEARQLVADGQVERALERVQEVVEGDPESVPLLVEVADVLGHAARFDDAERYLKRAQRLAPGDPDVPAVLGILSFRRGLYSQAEVELKQVCERDPEHALAHYYRGESLNRLGRADEALEVLRRAVELMPDDPRPYHTLGRLHDRRNEPDEASRMYRRARELHPS